MSRMSSSSSKGDATIGLILSFIEAGHTEEDETALAELRFSISELAGTDQSLDSLRKRVAEARKMKKSRERSERTISKLFLGREDALTYAYASNLCPSCARFKRRLKECPYCGHLEMTF